MDKNKIKILGALTFLDSLDKKSKVKNFLAKLSFVHEKYTPLNPTLIL